MRRPAMVPRHRVTGRLETRRSRSHEVADFEGSLSFPPEPIMLVCSQSIKGGTRCLSSCDPTASAATVIFRRPRRPHGSVRTNAPSASIVWKPSFSTSARTAAAALHHGPYARRRNGVRGFPLRSGRRRTSAGPCPTAVKTSQLTAGGSKTFRRRSDERRHRQTSPEGPADGGFRKFYFAGSFTPLAAFSISAATASGFDT